MILFKLAEYYDRLVEENCDIALDGYSPVKVSHVIEYDDTGKIVALQSLLVDKQPKIYILPQESIRPGKQIKSNLLYDNSSYSLGIGITIDKESQKHLSIENEKFQEFKRKNVEFLKNIDNPTAKAFCLFLNNWNPIEIFQNEILKDRLEELVKSNNIIFKLNTDYDFMHENAEIISRYQDSLASQEEETDKKTPVISQCLVTGEETIIQDKCHMPIKNIPNAQTSGALLISFNMQSTESFGKKQGRNAPISTKIAFKYATALNYLSRSETNKLYLGDLTLFFWADKKGGRLIENTIFWGLNSTEDIPDADNNESEFDNKKLKKEKEPLVRKIDYDTAKKAREIFLKAKSGLKIENEEISPDSNVYVLGIVPNKSRLSIRYWETQSFENMIKKISQHFEDLYVVGLRNDGFISPYQILINMEKMADKKKLKFQKMLIESIISEKPYSPILYQSTLSMCQNMGEFGGVNPVRVAFIKAYLKRFYRARKQYDKEDMITVGLNKNCTNKGYLLGRLFWVLEKIQLSASADESGRPTISKTIANSFLRSASFSPKMVFPQLLKLSEIHFDKLSKKMPKLAVSIDIDKQEVMGEISEFPTMLNIEEQGMFMLGYYHQKQWSFTSKEDKFKIESENN